MPNRKKRARRRQGGAGVILPVLIVVLGVAAAALAIILFYSNPLAADRDRTLPYDYGNLNFEESGSATAAPLVLGPAVTSSPEENPSSEEADAEESSSSSSIISNGSEWKRQNTDLKLTNRLVPTPMPGDYYLPVFDKALRTPDDTPMIAVTIDDCDKAAVMKQIVNIARFYGAKLTLFPTGDALMAKNSEFKNYVGSLKYEVENCIYDKIKRDYELSSGEMALQIWRQSIAASYSITKDYQQHFYRPKPKQSAYDQRTHFFIRKLGFMGVATYTHSYMGHSIDSLVGTLENGNIYQFDMSNESMGLFERFVEEASRKGYKLVTLNELFGLESNAVGSKLTISSQTLPEISDYVPTYYDLKLNYRSNAVFALQTRLIDLGYLTAANGRMEDLRADGIYGSDTSIAVSKFQAKVGLVATGNADVETQQRLFANDAPTAY